MTVSVEYLEMAAEVLQGPKQRSYELMEVAPGKQLLDVGCGPGLDTVALADQVGSLGRVFGVDQDPTMIELADARAREHGLKGRVVHRRVDVTAGLPFDDDLFDACRSERLLQNLPPAAGAPLVAELLRVTRPGGRVVLFDTDHGTKSFDSDELEVERKLARVAAEHCLPSGYAGRQLYRLAREAGLQDLTVEVVGLAITDYPLARWANFLDQVERAALEAAVINAEELARWQTDLERRAAAGTFFFGGSGVLVAGHKR
jgi:ubiquinone/menaquinone biosynthesis C-methylase UbiE